MAQLHAQVQSTDPAGCHPHPPATLARDEGGWTWSASDAATWPGLGAARPTQVFRPLPLQYAVPGRAGPADPAPLCDECADCGAESENRAPQERPPRDPRPLVHDLARVPCGLALFCSWP